MSTYTGVTNFQKTVRFLAHPVVCRRRQQRVRKPLAVGWSGERRPAREQRRI